MADNNPQSYFRCHNRTVLPSPVVAHDTTDSVKASHCYRLTMDGQHQLFKAPPGKDAENVIDVVRCREIVLQNFLLEPEQQNAITLKGWVNGYTLDTIWFTRHSRGAQDIDIGNWCDYDRVCWHRDEVTGLLVPVQWLPRTTRGLLRNVRMADGSKVRVRCLYADRPVVEGCEVEWVNVLPFTKDNTCATNAYFTAKRKQWPGFSSKTPTEDNATLERWELLPVTA